MRGREENGSLCVCVCVRSAVPNSLPVQTLLAGPGLAQDTLQYTALLVLG